ncbi:MAG: hydrolase [Pseudomonadota bacterium]
MIIESDFTPASGMRNPHIQTIWASMVRRLSAPLTRRERLELPDGDFIDIDHLKGNSPLRVCVFHGLEGSIQSNYAKGILNALAVHGIRATFVHFRGCSETPNRLLRSYHSGQTADMRYLFETLQQREPESPLIAVGYSLGANTLLKYLGESQHDSLLEFAVAICPPFSLALTAQRMNRGASRIYERYLVSKLQSSLLRKMTVLGETPYDKPTVSKLNTFELFDDAVTAPLNGFNGVQDYYTRASCTPFLSDIRTPCHIVASRDDPFYYPSSLPVASQLSNTTRMELSDTGGHVGYVGRDSSGKLEYWLERRIAQLIVETMQ